jgi:hypothetical protein
LRCTDYLVDSAGLALGLEDRCGPVALGAQDGGLLVTLGGEDLRLALAFGAQDCRTLVALGPHLLLHCVLDGLRRVDGLDLYPVDPQPPLAGGLVQHASELAVDGVAGGECALQVHGPDDIAQCGDRELFDALQEAGDLIGGCARVGHLEIEHSIDLDDQIVLGNHRLRLERDHLLP